MPRTLTRTTVVAATLVAITGAGTAVAGSTLIDGGKLKSNSVTSGKIKNRTIQNRDLKDGAVTGAKVLDGTLGASDIGGKVNDADKLDGKDSGDFIGRSELIPVAVKLAAGESRTIATSGPLKLVAQCTANDGGNDRVEILAETTAANSILEGFDNFNGGPLATDYLQPSTLAVDRQLVNEEQPTGTNLTADSDTDEGFAYAPSGEFLGITGDATALVLNPAGGKCAIYTTILSQKLS